MDDSGTYVLWIELPRAVTLEVGALGRANLSGGVYLYVGSARRAMGARVVRHLTREDGPPQALRARALAALAVPTPSSKRLHWHIDHLLELRPARVFRTTLLPGFHRECDLTLALQAEVGARVSVPGFGSSDCRRGCGAHLLLLPRGQRRLARRLLADTGEVQELRTAGK